MHISFAGKKVRLLALAVCIFMIIFVSANWKLYLDPDLNLQAEPFVCSVASCRSDCRISDHF